MRYEIYEKTEITTKIVEFTKDDFNLGKLWNYEKGKIDLDNIKETKWNDLIAYIPQSNIEELNEKGETAFSVITKRTIQVFKND